MATTKKAPVTPETTATEPPRDPCRCGCGDTPKGSKARFIPGHDARVHSAHKRMAAIRANDLELTATDEWLLPDDLPGLLLFLHRADVSLEEFQTFRVWSFAPEALKAAAAEASPATPVGVNEPKRPRRATRRAAGQDGTSRVDGDKA